MQKGDKVTWTRNFTAGMSITSKPMVGKIFKTYPKQPVWIVQTEDGELHSVNKSNLTLAQ